MEDNNANTQKQNPEQLKSIITDKEVILECEPGDFDTLDKLIGCFEEFRTAGCSPSLNYLDEGATQKLYEMLIPVFRSNIIPT